MKDAICSKATREQNREVELVHTKERDSHLRRQRDRETEKEREREREWERESGR